MKKTINDLRGSHYSKSDSHTSDSAHSAAKDHTATSQRQHNVGSTLTFNTSTYKAPSGSHFFSRDLYTYKGDLYLTTGGVNYLRQRLQEGGGEGWKNYVGKAVNLTTLKSGALWDLINSSKDVSNTVTAKDLMYWFTGGVTPQFNPLPSNENASLAERWLTSGTSDTWFDTYDDGRYSKLSTYADMLFAKSS